MGLLNRLIIDDVLIYDQHNKKMLQASRVSAKIQFIPLIQGRIVVNSAQFFGMNAKLYKLTADSSPNFQFVLDSLASKDTTKHTPLDLKINSLIIRHGKVSYDEMWHKTTPNILNTHHIKISNLSAHVILNHLTDDLINVNVKKLAFKEESGLDVKSLHLKLYADRKTTKLEDFSIELPKSRILLGDIIATYSTKNGKIEMPSLEFKGSIKDTEICLADLKCLIPQFAKSKNPFAIESEFTGRSTSLDIKTISINTKNRDIRLLANCYISGWQDTPRWFVNLKDLNISTSGMEFLTGILGTKIDIPQEVERIGAIHFNGEIGGHNQDISTRGTLLTDVGNAKLAVGKHENKFNAEIHTNGINLRKILNNDKFGTIATNIKLSGSTNNTSKLPAHLSSLSANGIISKFDYNNHCYQNFNINAALANNVIKGKASIDDKLINFDINGDYSLTSKHYDIEAQLNHISPYHVFNLNTKDHNFVLDNITVSARNMASDSYLELQAPFGQAHINGKFDYTTILQSVTNFIGDKLPTLPGLPKINHKANNNFDFSATLYDADWLNQMFNIPLTLTDPITVNGTIKDEEKKLNLSALLPDFFYDDMHFRNGDIDITTPNDTLFANISINKIVANGGKQSLRLQSSAVDNKLTTRLHYDNHSKKLPLRGNLLADTYFFVNENGQDAAHLTIHPSDLQIGDSLWTIEPSDIIYSKDNLLVDHFAIHHDEQHLIVNGLATKNEQDTLFVDLQDMDVAYILNLVNFHSVDFTGLASGNASMACVFGDPQLSADLIVKDFTFEHGEMGTLYAKAEYDKPTKRINIDAVADDGPESKTFINGYIAPAYDDILLGIDAKGTKMDFIESFTGSFMSNLDGKIYGRVELVGPLSKVNLQGDVKATGSFHMKALNTDYTFQDIHVTAVPEEITFDKDTIYDRNGNIAIVTGGLHHQHLTRLSYDIDVKANHFLGFDTHSFGEDTFYGTVFATGNVGIHGKSGETIIDVDATPERNSIIVYNAASPDAISDQSFIHWRDVTDKSLAGIDLSVVDSTGRKKKHVKIQQIEEEVSTIDIPSDMRINFLVNANPNLTLKVMMDNETGDYLTLNGDGVIRANYFNKGAFDMFGNYTVDHGTYKLTVQNIIRKDFTFQKGGTIAFGGDAFDATINLTAKYTVNGVSLADLQIGRSFSSNNIRVDCLMNITGTAGAPKVDFTFDMPTVNNEAKQMVTSIINSEEEMNQQVLYLLAVGRFYTQTNNNNLADGTQQQSQTSLAMQSLLSGTLSQQINNVLSTVINNNNWNFGANISTGDEGFNNAEYEGILSGRMLNNRLIFNGQFGYRDNSNATTSFIGDFDLSYLLLPNGNLALKVYNQTNDRYFTRNSLNTQGIGVMMKKDFNGWRDLFRITRKKDKDKNNKDKKQKDNKKTSSTKTK